VKVLFVCPYPTGTAASQRFRFEQYFPLLQALGVAYATAPFLSHRAWQVLYRKGHTWAKIMAVLGGFLRRLGWLFYVGRYDLVFVHREATPLGYPFFEWAVRFLWRKPMVFDFDDAIWLPNTTDTNGWVAWLKFHKKTALICRWAATVSAGNAYLADYARQFNPNVVINPTTLDTEQWHNPAVWPAVPKTPDALPIIGWTGTHSTLPYLQPLLPVLQRLAERYAFQFCVIADQNPDFQLPFYKFIPWQKATEIPDLLQFDIGLMPLTEDAWAKGKCGFKALQYMALGIPALVSPIGVNTEIVQDGVNGFWCHQETDWEAALTKLLQEASLRQRIGIAAREMVVKRFSCQANAANFLAILGIVGL